LNSNSKAGIPGALPETASRFETEKRWPLLRKETAEFFAINNPFLADSAKFIFNPMKLSDPSVDRQAGTVTYTASPSREGSTYNNTRNPAEVFYTHIINDAAFKTLSVMGIDEDYFTFYLVQAELVNGSGKVIATTPAPPERFTQFSQGDYGNNFIFQTRINASEDIYGTVLLTWNHGWRAFSRVPSGVTFTVPIADITDTGMTARVVKVFQYTEPDDNTGVFELLKTTEFIKYY
jgi:hypothetical protein